MSLMFLALKKLSPKYEEGYFDAAYVLNPNNIESFHFLQNVSLIFGKTTFETMKAIRKLEQNFEQSLTNKDIVFFLPVFFMYHLSTNSCLKKISRIHQIARDSNIVNPTKEINDYIAATLAVFRTDAVVVDENLFRFNLFQLKYSFSPGSPYNIIFSPMYLALRANNFNFIKAILNDVKLTQNQKIALLNNRILDKTFLQTAGLFKQRNIIMEVLNTPHLTSEQKFILLSTRTSYESAFELFAAREYDVIGPNLANTILADILRSDALTDIQKLNLLKIIDENKPYKSKSALHLAAKNLRLKNFILECLPKYKPIIERLIREIIEKE
jgi:hypothetical protein